MDHSLPGGLQSNGTITMTVGNSNSVNQSQRAQAEMTPTEHSIYHQQLALLQTQQAEFERLVKERLNNINRVLNDACVKLMDSVSLLQEAQSLSRPEDCLALNEQVIATVIDTKNVSGTIPRECPTVTDTSSPVMTENPYVEGTADTSDAGDPLDTADAGEPQPNEVCNSPQNIESGPESMSDDVMTMVNSEINDVLLALQSCQLESAAATDIDDDNEICEISAISPPSNLEESNIGYDEPEPSSGGNHQADPKPGNKDRRKAYLYRSTNTLRLTESKDEPMSLRGTIIQDHSTCESRENKKHIRKIENSNMEDTLKSVIEENDVDLSEEPSSNTEYTTILPPSTLAKGLSDIGAREHRPSTPPLDSAYPREVFKPKHEIPRTPNMCAVKKADLEISSQPEPVMPVLGSGLGKFIPFDNGFRRPSLGRRESAKLQKVQKAADASSRKPPVMKPLKAFAPQKAAQPKVAPGKGFSDPKEVPRREEGKLSKENKRVVKSQETNEKTDLDSNSSTTQKRNGRNHDASYNKAKESKVEINTESQDQKDSVAPGTDPKGSEVVTSIFSERSERNEDEGCSIPKPCALKQHEVIPNTIPGTVSPAHKKHHARAGTYCVPVEVLACEESGREGQAHDDSPVATVGLEQGQSRHQERTTPPQTLLPVSRLPVSGRRSLVKDDLPSSIPTAAYSRKTIPKKGAQQQILATPEEENVPQNIKGQPSPQKKKTNSRKKTVATEEAKEDISGSNKKKKAKKQSVPRKTSKQPADVLQPVPQEEMSVDLIASQENDVMQHEDVEPRRRRRAATQISYKEPSLNMKLRQDTKNARSGQRSGNGKASTGTAERKSTKKSKVVLSTITNITLDQ